MFSQDLLLYESLIKPLLLVEVDDIYVGETATVKITVNDDFNSQVYARIGSEYSDYITLHGGKNTISIDGLTIGEKIFQVTFNGDSKYSAK